VPVLTWTDVVDMASSLPGVEESTSYRTPARKVVGKLIARHRTDADSSVRVSCELDEKEALVASDDSSFFTEPHDDGYGAILVHLETVDPAQLAELLTQAWWQRAPAKLRKQLERS
jgi:Uncharacterized protein conserved in bacteria